MAQSSVRLTIEGGLARITLANPANRNAVSLDFCHGLVAATTRCLMERSVRAVLLTGEGDYFSVGGDLKEFMRNRDNVRAYIKALADQFHIALAQMHRMRAPVIVAANGTAAGAGLSLVCSGDMAVATRSAKFTSAYTRSGLSPDGSGTYTLPRIVGRMKAFDLMATNPVMSADEACELGIISRVFDDESFAEETEALARQISEAPTDALMALKRLLRQSMDSAYETQLQREAESIAELAGTEATLIVLDEFLNKKR